MKIDKEEQLLRKRFLELARVADNRGYNTYTDFLNLNEISIFYSIKHELPKVNYDLFGGYIGAERKVLCFYADTDVKAFSDYITCIKMIPLNKKFSDDLNHRDFLGALMNLGVERCVLGDILVKEKEGFLFCETSISEFIADNLTKVKHTNVRCEILTDNAPEIRPVFKEIKGSVSSARLDAVIALAFHTSRNSILGLISGGKVFVDGRLVEFGSYQLKEEETVSVRGMGKFIYKGMENQTKKGRFYISILKYI